MMQVLQFTLLAGPLVGGAVVVRRADCDADSRHNERGGDDAGAGSERTRRPTAVRQGGRYTHSHLPPPDTH